VAVIVLVHKSKKERNTAANHQNFGPNLFSLTFIDMAGHQKGHHRHSTEL